MHKGLLLFGLGAAVLPIALWRSQRGDRRLLYGAFFVALLAAVSVLAVESVLVLFPWLLGGRIANYTFSGYHQERGGIYGATPTWRAR